MYPDDRRYSKDHEWVRVESREAVVGITEFAQKELGDIVYVERPPAGKQVQAGDVLGTIESVKAVSEIFAPVAGTVVDSNAVLDTSPELVNRDPHGEGWYCRIALADPAEVAGLLEAAAYTELVGS